VGLNIQLNDFVPEQVSDLNRCHGFPVVEGEIPELMELVGGHPYLVRQALYTLVSESLSLRELMAVADSSEGPFGKHLLYYRHSLNKNPTLLNTMQKVVRKKKVPDENLLERLAAVGLIKREEGMWSSRCGLYEQYFARTL
jgi:hypothetical protein